LYLAAYDNFVTEKPTKTTATSTTY